VKLTVDHNLQTLVIAGTAEWCQFGVRDPSLLIGKDNTPARIQGKYFLYFNGRDKSLQEGGRTKVGMATSVDLREWEVAAQPCFSDGDYAAVGSVVMARKDEYWMFYSHGTDIGFRRAYSQNGTQWQAEDCILLRPDQFNCSRIGLPSVHYLNGKWGMVFEGITKNGFRVFGAASDNGTNWHPMNMGEPLYNAREDAWDGSAQANPYLFSCDSRQNRLLLLYNAYSVNDIGGWDIGYVPTIFEESLTCSADNSHLLLDRLVCGLPAGRLEGPKLIKIPSTNEFLLYWFTLPSRDSYCGGTIRMANASITPSEEGLTNKMILEKEIEANDKLAERYFSIWDTYPIQKFTHETETHWLKQNISPRSKVLLAGSGGGRELPALLDLACEIVAMDISPQMLRVGQERYAEATIQWRIGNIQAMPRDLNGFDAIVSLGGVLIYLPDIESAIKCFHQALRPGGKVYASVVNSQHGTELKIAGKSAGMRHRRPFSREEIVSLFEKQGFAKITTTGYRYLVDYLPASWNSDFENNADKAQTLEKLLKIEHDMLKLGNVDDAKLIWICAEKPADHIYKSSQ